jgi:hypothetical protein
MKKFVAHVRVVDKMRRRRQHEGESPASCDTGGKHGGIAGKVRHRWLKRRRVAGEPRHRGQAQVNERVTMARS